MHIFYYVLSENCRCVVSAYDNKFVYFCCRYWMSLRTSLCSTAYTKWNADIFYHNLYIITLTLSHFKMWTAPTVLLPKITKWNISIVDFSLNIFYVPTSLHCQITMITIDNNILQIPVNFNVRNFSEGIAQNIRAVFYAFTCITFWLYNHLACSFFWWET